MKSVLLTVIEPSEEKLKGIGMQLQRYGILAKGHIWEDDLKKMAWSAPRSELLNKETLAWLILISEEEISKPSTRFGLSMLTLMLQAERGHAFPVIMLFTENALPDPGSLPTPMKGNTFFSISDPGVYSKIIAEVHMPKKEIKRDYRIDIFANPHIGLFFEVGPADGIWHGAMFGVSGANITHHAVGPKGKLPEKSVVNYPVEGMKIALGDKEYIAWAVQNKFNAETSYYVKIDGTPDSLLFGPYSDSEEAEVYILTLS